MNEIRSWKVRRKTELLIAMMEALQGDARISLEGGLQGFHLEQLSDISNRETDVLKRNTIWPKQDFLVAPLTKDFISVIQRIWKSGVPHRVCHIQIERAGILEFGSYDSFSAVIFGAGVSPELIDSLVARGILARL